MTRKRSPGIEVAASVRCGPASASVARWGASLLSAAPPGPSRPGRSGRIAGRSDDPALSILLCGDARMRGLNREWRGQDRPTDVLSFPSGETAFLGDLVVDVPYAARQARRLGHPLEREVKVLLAHGILHLLGYDHETDDGAMFLAQRRLVLRAFGRGPDGVPEDEP